VQRSILGFHQDEDGDWVAELSCLHNQHLRHRPPFQERPWSWTTPNGWRASEHHSLARCATGRRCPKGLTLLRTAGPFDTDTLPAGLRTWHRVAEGTWGCLRVLEGSVGFVMDLEPFLEARLTCRQFF
jgi:hypothetical protein